ncbi:class I SAM-dependent methyltransferase [Mycolicibacterium thermoresistibile]|jgi:methyltransferase (TIGR00027 family)
MVMMFDVTEAASARSEGDSWDITESVGATALGVAAERALETSQPDPLIRDEYAFLLVSAAGPPWTQLASSDLSWLGDDETARRMHLMSRDYQAVRTHYFDRYFAAAARAGIRQIVLLAAGLDSRAYRLDWPAGTVVYELDQPRVLDFKNRTLQAHGAVAKADRRTVAVDLRDDWPAALRHAGFDPAAPTAWLAEGLLCYLPADAQDRLFERITALSAPGSRLAVEAFHHDPQRATERRRAEWRDRTARMKAALDLNLDFEALTYDDPDRADAGEWLAAHGWHPDSVPGTEEMARLGRPVPADLLDVAVPSTLLRAHLNGASR